MLNFDLHKLKSLSSRAIAVAIAGLALVALALILPTEEAGAGDNLVDDKYVFPLPSKHTYGDGVGAGRGHDGQDLFAKCGRNLVAAHDGKVQRAEYDSSGYGYLFVLDVKGTGIDLVYAHLQKKPLVRKGEKVKAGQKIGKVGATGNASGCHLHFEMIKSPGFWEGGKPMRKVTKYLKTWDKYS